LKKKEKNFNLKLEDKLNEFFCLRTGQEIESLGSHFFFQAWLAFSRALFGSCLPQTEIQE
jgi:hypothetical protein